MILRRRIIMLFVLSAIAGCTVGPRYQQPRMAIPHAFAATQPSPTTQSTAVSLPRWWTALNDSELNSLIDRAIAANLDLGMAVDRLQAARQAEAVFTGNSLPDIEFSAGAGKGTSTDSTRGRVPVPLNAAYNTTGYSEITQILGFDAAWEIDLFGQVRRQAEAVIADTSAAAAERNEVLVILVADVARSYVDVRTLQARIAINQQAIAGQQRTADFARVRYQRGLSNQLDAVLAERELASTQATLAPLQAQLAATCRAMAILLGEFPEQLGDELNKPQPLPDVSPQVDQGVPSELLMNRPDIRRAQDQLIAANSRIGVATANLYPQILLTGGGGVEGQGLGRSPVQWTGIWSVGPALRWGLFDFGALDAAVSIQDYRTRELLLAYRKAVINSVREVDDALNNYQAQQSRHSDLGRALDAARKARLLANQRYERGLTDFLNVLDADRQLFALQDEHVQSQQQMLIQFIAVCKALGGGWQDCASPAAPPPPRPALVAAVADVLGQNRQR